MSKDEQETRTHKPGSLNSDYLDELDSWDKEIIRIKMEDPTLSNVKIGKIMGISNKTVGLRMNKALVIRTLKDMQKVALQILLDAQSEAALTVINIMNTSDNPSIRLKAAEMVLKGVLSDRVNLEMNNWAQWVEETHKEKE